MSARLIPVFFLVALGFAWGMTIPLTKVAVSTGHGHFGLIFWQLLYVMIVLGGIGAALGYRVKIQLRHMGFLCFIAFFGTLIPNSLSYIAAVELPSGVMSIVISMVPMSALPIALFLRAERFEWKRLAGLLFGAFAMVALIGPQTSLPDPAKAGFVLLAALATVCYGVEGNYVARFGLRGLEPIQVMFYSSLVGLVFVTPMALATGQFYNPLLDWGIDDGALLLSSGAHAFAYSGYLWLVGRAGPVFAAQVSYIVTLSGVLLAIVLLGETYSGYIWFALGLVLVGVFLVQPRKQNQQEA